MSDRIAVRVVISGRVQGVWYRGWTVEQARSRGVAGWVRNRADGTVEALFCGAPAAVRAMIAACRQGPPAARVYGVQEFPHLPTDDAAFQQLPTA
jgi:acylphosphatase